MNLELDIEKLSIQGVQPDAGLAKEIEGELERLLREEGVPEALKYGSEICIDYEEFDAESNSPNQIGERIARVIYRNLSERI